MQDSMQSVNLHSLSRAPSYALFSLKPPGEGYALRAHRLLQFMVQNATMKAGNHGGLKLLVLTSVLSLVNGTRCH